MSIEKTQKNAEKYACINCDFITANKFDYSRHIKTKKHILRISAINYDLKSMNCEKKTQQHICNRCNKVYKDFSGLWRHNKKCSANTSTPHNTDNQIPIDYHLQTTIILELVKQNQEFKQLLLDQNKTMIEVAKNSQVNHNTISNSNNHNSNNKTFNLQFFLNETCKDAMNMKDFIQSLEMSFSELEKMGEIGFAEGMSRLFVDRLNKLDITQRPIHCSDVKREIIHIKDDNKWERDNANLDRLRKIIKQLTHKNILRVDDWKQANKGCTEYNSRKNEQYLKMNIQAIGPVDDEEVKRDFGKIIRRVAESTAIDKKYLIA